MSDPLENTIENSVNTWARGTFKDRILIRKMNGQGFRHWPDRLYEIPNTSFYIEYKKLGQGPDPGQVEMHKRLTRLGKRVYVVDNIPDGKAIIAAEMKGAPLYERAVHAA
jgi:hypothetical protein